MTSGNMAGLSLVDKYYEDYGGRARELKQEGRKVIGYLCAYVPLELITAAGLVPFRMKADVNEPITRADAQMETIICPLVRSCFDVSLKGRYGFIDGIVIPHACDSMCRTYDIWKYSLGVSYSHLVNLPHSTNDAALDFFKAELGTFRRSLERYVGREITDEGLARAVSMYNRKRASVRELYQLRKHEPPLISGTELAKTLIAAMGLPVEEATRLIKSVAEEVRPRAAVRQSTRIMVVGAEMDDVDFIKLIEDSGASVVADFLCPGAREYWSDVDVTSEPVDDIAERYLRRVNCGRTYRDRSGTYPEYLEARFGEIGTIIRDFKVEGVIIHVYRYCDPFGFDVPAMRGYVEQMGLPVLYLEDDYSMSAVGRLRTRIQSFLEIIS